MIPRFTPIGRTRSRLAAGLLLALTATGPTEAADPTRDATGQDEEKPRPTAIAAPKSDGKEARPAAEPDSKQIADAIAVLRKTEIRKPGQWGRAVRTLAQIGKPALPALIEELDRATAPNELGALAFAFRAIGDPRAVPALIRALPRTLVDNVGDHGVAVYDPLLLLFLQRYDVDPGAQGLTVAFGTPYHEITGALHALTGQRFDLEAEMHFIDLQGSPRQRWLRRRLYHELAAQWAIWWKKNARRFTDDPAFIRISLPPLPEAPQAAAASADQPFPTGNRVRVANGPINAVVGPPQALDHYRTFMDLDTARESSWPRDLPAPSKVKTDEVAAFAAREGFDLRGIESTDPKSGRPCYAIQGLGLRAWQIDNRRYDTIEEDFRRGEPPPLDRPVRDLLADFDPKSGIHHPENKASFLFVTREGTTGALQLNGMVTQPYGPEDIGKPARPDLRPDPPDEPGKPAPLKSFREAYRGVRFTYKFLYTDENEAR